MAGIGSIAHLVGTWTGRTLLWLTPGSTPLESPTDAAVYSIAGDRVLSIDYGWVYEGASQDGRLLVAPDDTEGMHMVWCDSFHMDASIMDLVGAAAGEAITAAGSYRLGDAEAWGWRIELEPRGDDAFQLRMYNILPESMGSAEALAVQADYSRA